MQWTGFFCTVTIPSYDTLMMIRAVVMRRTLRHWPAAFKTDNSLRFHFHAVFQ